MNASELEYNPWQDYVPPKDISITNEIQGGEENRQENLNFSKTENNPSERNEPDNSKEYEGDSEDNGNEEEFAPYPSQEEIIKQINEEIKEIGKLQVQRQECQNALEENRRKIEIMEPQSPRPYSCCGEVWCN